MVDALLGARVVVGMILMSLLLVAPRQALPILILLLTAPRPALLMVERDGASHWVRASDGARLRSGRGKLLWPQECWAGHRAESEQRRVEGRAGRAPTGEPSEIPGR